MKSKDFYYIQDQLSLAWQYSANHTRVIDDNLLVLSKQIDDLAVQLVESDPGLAKFIDLTTKKISLLENAIKDMGAGEKLTNRLNQTIKQTVAVSLSSSGMGFFSEYFAEEEAQITINLALDALGLDIVLSAIVVECRSSADPENPGFWIRARFSREQETEIDKLLAHVTQRQIERIERRSEGK